MNRRVHPIVAVFVFLAASAVAARAQATQETQQPAPAQTTAQNSATNTPASQTPPKKVWTNEEMSSLDPHAGVSTVGNANSAKPGAKPHANSKNHDPKWYQDQIAKLQAQIPPLDKQIAELQAAIDGKPTGDAVKSTRPSGVKFDNWTSELAQYQKKRDDLLAQISVLQDQARHAGVAPNALP
ncbi:MAG TPA: hypothetical protein VEX69_02120 [Candidatus Limnocylindria bacterium]|nr:hypothetical protein [Candidatus Limnocylindria bacterium]